MTNILVLGDLNLDVLATGFGALPCSGEDRSDVRAVPGGSAATFARTAAIEGAAVTFFGSTGTDLVGDLLLRSLEDAGVTPRVRRVDRPSGIVLSIRHGTERTMICCRGANDGLTPNWIREEAFQDADHLHLSGYTLLSDPQRESASRAIELARRRKILISVDPPPANLIESVGLTPFRTALNGVSWLFPNLTEGRTLTGLDRPEEIADALATSFDLGAVTLGSGGALAWQGKQRHRCHTVRAVDTNSTGAGDVYAGAFVVAFYATGDLESANRRGCDVARAHLHRRHRS
jgi:ribokinase